MFVSWIEYKQMSVQSCKLFRSDMEVGSVDKVIKPTDEVGDSTPEISNLTTPRTIPDLDSSILKHVPHRPSRLALETDIFSLENSIESIAIKDNNLKSDEIKPNMTENSIVSSHEDALNSNTDRPSISGSDADGIKYVALRSSNLTTDSGLASSFKSIENIPIQNTVIPEEVVQGNNVFEPVKEVHAIISGEAEQTEWPMKSHSIIGSHGRDAAASSDLQLNSSSVNYDSDRRSITSRRSITEEQSEPDGAKLRVKKGSTVRKSINAEDSTSTPTIRRRITSFIKTHFPTSNQQIQQDSELHDHIPEKSASKSIRGILAGLELKILINSAHDTSNVMSPTIKTSGIQLPEKHSRSQSGYESDCLSPSSASNSHSNIFLRESKVEPAPLSPKPGYSANEISNKHTKSTSTDLVSNTPISPTMKYQGSPMTSNDFSASPDRDSTEKEEKKSHEWHFPKLSTIKRRESSKKRSSSLSMSKSGSEISLSEKYGPTDLVLGKGAYATVRLAHKREKDAKWFAVKEFRKKRREESEKDYIKKVISEFCISSSLHHINVVETLDLIKDEKDHWCVVMEYCPGGDLLTKMTQIGFSGNEEKHCLFKQIVKGIEYMHQTGVVHRDLKPENIVLDVHHRTPKITDFGVASVFKTQFEKQIHKIHGICGSAPYIAPEEWLTDSEYAPTKVDIWALGMIFYAMLAKGMLWGTSKPDDPNYQKYLKRRETGFPPFEMQDHFPKLLLYKLMDPNPATRPEASEVLSEEWMKSIKTCDLIETHESTRSNVYDHHHLAKEQSP